MTMKKPLQRKALLAIAFTGSLALNAACYTWWESGNIPLVGYAFEL